MDMKQCWCPETRLRDHREQERVNREAEEKKRAHQSHLFAGGSTKASYRHEFPALPKVLLELIKLSRPEHKVNKQILKILRADAAPILDIDVKKPSGKNAVPFTFSSDLSNASSAHVCQAV